MAIAAVAITAASTVVRIISIGYFLEYLWFNTETETTQKNRREKNKKTMEESCIVSIWKRACSCFYSLLQSTDLMIFFRIICTAFCMSWKAPWA